MGAFLAGNRAIVDAFKYGILRNASLMAPAPHFLHAAHLVKDVPDLCLGLHITLTAEWDNPRWGPISPKEEVPSLVDFDGYFFPTVQDLFRHGDILGEALREVRAQLTRARALGLDIRYLDEHMGVGWLFDPADPQHTRLSKAFRQFAHEEGLVWHEDIADMRRIEYGSNELSGLLGQLQEGRYLLITHPAYLEPETQVVVGQSYPQQGAFAQARLRDYHSLCDPRTAQVVHERQIQLIRYDEFFVGEDNVPEDV